MLSCRELTELVTDYTEGRMGLGNRLAFCFHLLKCRGCRAYLAQVRTTRGLLGQIEQPAPSPEVEAALLREFGKWAARSEGGKSKGEKLP